MKKKINNKKIPAYAFGIQQGLDIASVLGVGMQGLANEDSTLASAGTALSSGAQAAATGMTVAGPVGAIVGGGLGLIGGALAGRNRRRQLQYQKLRKKIANTNQYNDAIEANLANEYAVENDPVYTFENGGILPDLAYVDNNEVIRDNAGNIVQVPNTKPGTDNHLINASNLDSVLSDKIKRPGTNKTFAQEGKKLVSMTKGSKGKDKFARNADKLNQINANAMYEELLAEQEAVKVKKGIKPKVKGIPAYDDGYKGQGKIVRWGDIKHLYNLPFATHDDTRFRILDDGTLIDQNGLATGSLKKRKVGAGTLTESVNVPTNVAPTAAVPEAYGWAQKNAETRLSTPIDPVQLLADRKEYWRNNDLYYADQLPEVVATAKAPETPAYARYMQRYEWDPVWNNALANAQQTDNARLKRAKSARIADNTPGLLFPVINDNASNTVDGITGETIPANYQVDGITGETVLVGNNKSKTANTNTVAANVAIPTNTGTTKKATPSVKPVKAPEQAPLLNVLDFNPILTSVQGLNVSNKPTTDLTNLPSPSTVVNPKSNKPKSKTPFDFDFGNLAGLTPVLHNWIQSMRGSEVEDQVFNPYAGAINRSMASRRLNIAPTLAANRRTRAIARDNMAKLSPNTGMNLAYGNQLATSEYADNATTYANRDNANNQYLGEYSSMMNNLGQQYIQNTVLTNDLNARNRAAARNFGSTAAGQFGKWSQVRQLEKNQAKRDKMVLPALQEFLKSYYPTETYDKMFS